MKTKFTITLSAVLAVCSTAFSVEEKSLDGSRPNIILMMADDLGYGDTGFNGNTIIKTPHLDRMAQDGVKLTHFYAGNSVCSPTRGTCLTGRHHHRYGIWTANKGHLPKQEITLARMLKEQGYATGHLGTLDKVISAKDANRKPEANFAPPWQRDYDRSFVTESAVNTWNPGSGSRSKDNPFYDDGKALNRTTRASRAARRASSSIGRCPSWNRRWPMARHSYPWFGFTRATRTSRRAPTI